MSYTLSHDTLDSITKLQQLSESLPATVDEVKEVVEEYETLVSDSTEGLTWMTASYKSHQTLDQALTHLEQSLIDTEDKARDLTVQKDELGHLKNDLKVSDPCIL